MYGTIKVLSGRLVRVQSSGTTPWPSHERCRLAYYGKEEYWRDSMSQNVLVVCQSHPMRMLAICGVVETELERLHVKLETLEKEEARFLTDLAKRLIEHIRQSMIEQEKSLATLRREAEAAQEHDEKTSPKQKTDMMRRANELKAQNRTLRHETFYTVKDWVLGDLTEQVKPKNSEFALSDAQLESINTIEDALLRETVYDLWHDTPEATFEHICDKAREQLHTNTQRHAKTR